MNHLKQYLKKSTSDFGIEAWKVDLSKITLFKIEQVRDELITKNKMGYMKISTDEYTDMFIKGAVGADQHVLEIGCAYGFVAQKILNAGGKMVACDLGEEHLEHLLKSTKSENLQNLHVYPGEFPNEVSFPKESFSAILASRILHFLDKNELEEGLKKIHEWLIPGGKLYFTAVSLYHDTIREKFLPIYKKRVEKGLKWPGVIRNHKDINPDHSDYIPQLLHVFDIPELEKILPEFGFKIEKISLFNYPDDTTAGEKGHIGFVARKI